jgi:hypothetical protein
VDHRAGPDTVLSVDRLRPYPVTIFSAVTLAIWGNRIWLAWTNPDDTVARKLLWSLPITLFVAAAVVLLVAVLRGVDPTSRWFVATVRGFALGTTVFWAIRAPMILLADHGVAFKVVHAVLAIGSIAAAAGAWRSTSRAPDRAAPAPASR